MNTLYVLEKHLYLKDKKFILTTYLIQSCKSAQLKSMSTTTTTGSFIALFVVFGGCEAYLRTTASLQDGEIVWIDYYNGVTRLGRSS